MPPKDKQFYEYKKQQRERARKERERVEELAKNCGVISRGEHRDRTLLRAKEADGWRMIVDSAVNSSKRMAGLRGDNTPSRSREVAQTARVTLCESGNVWRKIEEVARLLRDDNVNASVWLSGQQVKAQVMEQKLKPGEALRFNTTETWVPKVVEALRFLPDEGKQAIAEGRIAVQLAPKSDTFPAVKDAL